MKPPTSPESGAKPPRWSVRTLLTLLIVASLLPGVIGAAALFIYEYQRGRAQLERDTLQTVRALSQAVDNQILKVEALAHGLATSGSLAQGDLASFHKQARQTLQRAHLVASVVLIDRNGWQVLNTLKEFGAPLPFNGNPPLMRRVFETGEPVVSDLYLGAVMHRPIMTVAVPVIIDGRIPYVLVAPILQDKFKAILTAQGLPAGWVASILDSTGTVVAQTGGAREAPGTRAAPDFLERFMAAAEGSLQRVSAAGIPVLAVFARSPATRWGVEIEIPRKILEAPLARTLRTLALGVAALFAVGLALARLLGRRIARPFLALVAPAQALGAGEAVLLPAVEVTEAAALTKAIGDAASLLEKRTAALQESESRLRLAVEGAGAGAWDWDLLTGQLLPSEKLLELYGLPPAFPTPGFPAWAGAAQEEDRLAVATRLQGALAGQAAEFRDEFRIRHGRLGIRWIMVLAHIVRGAGGKPVRMYGISFDITDHKEWETELARRVSQRTEELAAANRQLEGFVFATSHDLRGPLGRINSFSALLEQRYKDQLAGEGLLFLNFIRENAVRLTQLVDDLLSHARVSGQALTLAPVDIAALVRTVLEEMADDIRRAGAEVRLDLPAARVLGDPQPLGLALANLVQNALKYSRGVEGPVIEIGAREGEGRVLVWVGDNGIGFDMAYHDRIFEIFQRLHTYSEYEGSGVGLALVKRALERMGGRVWAQSEPGRGSAFYLELQAAAPAPAS